MDKNQLKTVARRLVAPKKGILAADESTGTIEKRLDTINLPSTEENRRAWRQLLFTTPEIEKFISGVIMFDETLRLASLAQGKPAARILQDKGIIPGIKVDKGAKNMALFPGEKVTEGLDGLRERLAEYVGLGAKFTKWRAVITLGKGIPTQTCIDSNAEALARFAALSQEAGLVPIVEPEVLMDGTHDVKRHGQASVATLKSVFAHLKAHRIFLPGMLLKTNMVLSGKEAKRKAGEKEVAQATLLTFRQAIPRQVPGVVFLSGGQTPDQATSNLDAINKASKEPWQLSFSYGRALQEEALKTWKGKPDFMPAAQEAFYRRAQSVSAARAGAL